MTIEPPPPVQTIPPVETVRPAGRGQGLGIASLVLGILSLCGSLFWYCSAPLAIAAIITGILGLRTPGRTLALIGVILAVIGLLMAIVFAIIGLNSGPIMQQLQTMQATLQAP